MREIDLKTAAEQQLPSVQPASPDSYRESGDESGDDREVAPSAPQSRGRIAGAMAVIVLLGSIAILPPLINVSRYQHRIAASIAASLGRPVQIDSVTLNLLPMPGFTLSNFVVSEDPSFGYEPVIRASSVKATLRMRSLWHRRVEFSRIALEDPSVNLVRRADGKWNIEGILLQASRLPVIPTEDKASPAAGVQRFPYIEATGARLNLKEGLEKKPLSLTDAEFALWLPQSRIWHLRMEAHPTRTDTSALDTGLLRIEGTLGKADRLEDVPIDLHAEWTSAPLGAASLIVMGHDAGARGNMDLRVAARGTVGHNDATARLDLHRLRRADFVPADPLDVGIDCKAHAEGVFESLEDLSCDWRGVQGGQIGLTGRLGNVRDLRTAEVRASWQDVQVASLADTLRVVSARDTSTLHASGLLSGEASCCTGSAADMPGTFEIAKPKVSIGTEPRLVDQATDLEGQFTGSGMTMTPIPLNLGGPEPATLTPSADGDGLHLHLAGTLLRSRLTALSQAFPQFGDGLEQALPPVETPTKGPEVPIHIDLVSTRIWANAGTQTWTATPHAVPVRRKRRHSRLPER